MKRIWVLPTCTFFLLALTGCHGPAKYNMSPGSVEVIIEGNGEFPEFLVGKWQSNKDGWEFVFEAGGKIPVARIAMGRTKITPGQTTTLPTRSGGKAVYVPGNWLVIYSPANRELTVDVVMNYIRIEMGDNVLQGKSRDILIGPVSEDGTMWHATVGRIPEYEGFPNDPNDLPYIREVIFEKIADEK